MPQSELYHKANASGTFHSGKEVIENRENRTKLKCENEVTLYKIPSPRQ